MFGLFDWLKVGAGMAVGFVLASIYINVLIVPEAREEGRALERAAALERSMQIIRQRSATDAEIGRMPDGDLCRELGGVWLPDERVCQ